MSNILVALRIWSMSLQSKYVIFHCDNEAVVLQWLVTSTFYIIFNISNINIPGMYNFYKFYMHKLNSTLLSHKSVLLMLSPCSQTIQHHPPHPIQTTFSSKTSSKAISLAAIPDSYICPVQAIFQLYHHYPQPPLAPLFSKNTYTKVQTYLRHSLYLSLSSLYKAYIHHHT